MKDYEKFMLDNYNEELDIIREVIFDDKNICIKVGVDSETLVEDTAIILEGYKIVDDKETYDSYTIYDIEKTVCGFMATMGLLAGKYKKEHLEWLLEVM